GIQVDAFLALREVPQDRVRLSQRHVAVLQERNRAERVPLQIPGWSGPRERNAPSLVRKSQLCKQEADLERVRRRRVVVEQQAHRGQHYTVYVFKFDSEGPRPMDARQLASNLGFPEGPVVMPEDRIVFCDGNVGELLVYEDGA